MQLKIFIVLTFFLNLVQAYFTPIIDDEAYYWMWSRALDFGYFDHPPMIAWWISVGSGLFNGEIGVRLFIVLMNTISAFLVWKILLPKTKKEVQLFYVFYFSWIFVNIFSFVATPDAPLLFFTLFYLYVLKRFLENFSIGNSLLLSLAFAGLMYSKYHGLLVIIFTLLPIALIVGKQRNFYIAVVLSLVLYSPHLYWLYRYDFPALNYHLVDRSDESVFNWGRLGVYLSTSLLGALGLLSYYSSKAMVKWRSKTLFDQSVYSLAVLPILFFFLMAFRNEIQAQWLLISFIGIGLVFYEYYRNGINLRRVFIVGGINVCLLLMARIYIMIPVWSPFEMNREFANQLAHVDDTIVAFEKYQEASIFTFYNTLHKEGVVYRTMGNRESQFTLWNSESRLGDGSFAYVSQWMKSNDSLVGLKQKIFYVNTIDAYMPVNHLKASFKDMNEVSVVGGELLAVDIELSLAQNSLGDFKKNNTLSVVFTKDKQYNLIEALAVDMFSDPVYDQENECYRFSFSERVSLASGLYKVYVAVTPRNMPMKYISKSLRVEVVNSGIKPY